MNSERSKRTSTLTDAGSCARRSSTRRRTPSATSTVLVPGCFWTARTIPREPLNPAVLDPVDHLTYVLESHRRAIPLGDHQGTERRGIGQLSVGLDGPGLVLPPQH